MIALPCGVGQQFVEIPIIAIFLFEYFNVIFIHSSTPDGIKWPDTLISIGSSWLNMKHANCIG